VDNDFGIYAEWRLLSHALAHHHVRPPLLQ
jgi:hypothetical protein